MRFGPAACTSRTDPRSRPAAASRVTQNTQICTASVLTGIQLTATQIGGGLRGAPPQKGPPPSPGTSPRGPPAKAGPPAPPAGGRQSPPAGAPTPQAA